MMDIGAIGWWNYDNAGDLAMLAALRRGLAPHRVVPIDIGFPATPDTIYRLNRLDFVLFGGGTLISGQPDAPLDTFDRWSGQLECPYGVVGLGVAPFREEYKPAVEALLDRAEFFYVRDSGSHAMLYHHPKVQVVPDLTFADPLPYSQPTQQDSGGATAVCGVNLRRSSRFDPEPWLRAISRLPVRVKGVVLSSFSVFDEVALLSQLDPTCPMRSDRAVYGQIDMMIATAFHAVLFSVQAGVPVIAIGYAPKVRRFMEDVGLAGYVLQPDEDGKLPELVADVIAHRAALGSELRAIRARLQEGAQQASRYVREHIEQSGPRHRRPEVKVTVAVLASDDAVKNQRTLASVVSQTYGDVEMVQLGPNPQKQIGAQLQEALAGSRGDYLTWVEAGDWFADDALECLASYLESDPRCDAVYADYYAMDRANLPLGRHWVPAAEKLFRRDVVGPCFLVRRSAVDKLGGISADVVLPGYDLWLRARATCQLTAFHAPLFYSARPVESRNYIERERGTRRRWRRARPLWARALWALLDTDLGERLIVRPVASLMRLLGRRSYV